MGQAVAQMTTSLDGYIAGPDDGPGRRLGTGGERLHYWVFGGPWSYDEQPTGEATGVDRQLLCRRQKTAVRRLRADDRSTPGERGAVAMGDAPAIPGGAGLNGSIP
jgi:hypothetical protein